VWPNLRKKTPAEKKFAPRIPLLAAEGAFIGYTCGVLQGWGAAPVWRIDEFSGTFLFNNDSNYGDGERNAEEPRLGAYDRSAGIAVNAGKSGKTDRLA
jgi:hypothetical protein